MDASVDAGIHPDRRVNSAQCREETMSNGEPAYLIGVLVLFAVFAAALFWGQIQTNR